MKKNVDWQGRDRVIKFLIKALRNTGRKKEKKNIAKRKLETVKMPSNNKIKKKNTISN